MKTSDFHFELPSELIAQHPLEERSASRLLVLGGCDGAVQHSHFVHLPDMLAPNDLLVFNNTRVIPARLWGRKSTGGKLELLIERVTGSHVALAHIRCSRSPAPGSRILLAAGPDDTPGPYELEVMGRQGELFELRSPPAVPLADILKSIGHVPLPPYIERDDEQTDRERYQTVYARREGAVAAPTAGLHFTEPLLAQLRNQGVKQAEVTLHVGAGTFQPVRVDNLEDHIMHREYLEVDESVCEAVREARAAGGRVVAVGTTAVRSLETASRDTGELRPYRGETDIFIYPGCRFHCVDAMITNFHLPESTLLMLVSAFAGKEHIMAAYAEAVARGYRFFSYGDAMFITANPAARLSA